MKTKIVKLLDGQEFILKNSMRTILIYEELTGKDISEIKTTKDYLYFLYATLCGCNRESFKYSWDEFIDMVDINPQLPVDFNEFNSTPEMIETPIEEIKKVKKK